MAQPVIQTSFHAGEWAPPLNARVDIAKYKAAAALLRNFFVDYRGGASSRAGSEYIIQCYKSGLAVRLIPFQASFDVTYMLEFGDQYIRFINNGNPVLEPTVAITGVSGNTVTATNTYSPGDWVFINGVGGITNINNKYFIVASATGANFTVTDLRGGAVTFTGSYTAGGTAARIYTLQSPYLAADLALLKFAQNVDQLILCHKSYSPYILTLIGPTNWTLVPIQFGSTVAQPTGLAVSQNALGAGSWFYSFVVTAVDANGQESPASSVVTLSSVGNQQVTAGTITVTWTAVSGASSYNVYKAELSNSSAPPVGAAFGFIGNCTGTDFRDTNIPPDFSQSPPVAQNPFFGAGVDHVTVTTPGTYTLVPTVTFAAPPAGFITATGAAVLQPTSVVIHAGTPGSGFTVGDIVEYGSGGHPPSNCKFVVATVSGPGGILTFQPLTYPGTVLGSVTSFFTPGNPMSRVGGGTGTGSSVDVTWGVTQVNVNQSGSGYTAPPAITFSAGAAAATAVLQDTTAGNPGVVTFFQQRLVLADTPKSVQTFYMSQPGSYYNFNISNPIVASDAITGSIVAGQLNEIQSMVPVPTGLMTLTSRAAWLINGGTSGAAVTPIDVTANAHSFNGASDIPPIVANFDVLFVQSKGSIVRDLSFNFYAQIFTGTDISILSSHLFYGFTLQEWAWAEEPFKVVWAVRNDGVMLTLTFLKEQELIGWSHSDTDGLYKSVATIPETVSIGKVDAIYTVVQRTIGGQTVKYIERTAERIFPNGVADAWCVDSGLQYVGAPATVMSGLDHLVGKTVTGLADGIVVPPQTVASDGTITLGTPASKVTLGLPYVCDLQTLALDLGEPTVQGKRKKITGVTVRVADTLGLTIGKTFSSLVPMKDLVVGNVGSATNTVVTNLVTGDARTIIDPAWDVPGQYCIRQSNPMPVSILGVIPEIELGDTATR